MRVVESPPIGHNKPPETLKKRTEPHFVTIYPEPVPYDSWVNAMLNSGRYHYRVEVNTGVLSERCSVVASAPEDVRALLNYLREVALTRGASLMTRKLVKDTDAQLGIKPGEAVS